MVDDVETNLANERIYLRDAGEMKLVAASKDGLGMVFGSDVVKTDSTVGDNGLWLRLEHCYCCRC
jgi:hypothetical protein